MESQKAFRAELVLLTASTGSCLGLRVAGGLWAGLLGPFAVVAVVLIAVVVVAQWQWMERIQGQTAAEFMAKAGMPAFALVIALILMKLTSATTRGPVLETALDLLSWFGLVGIALFPVFAFAASKRIR